LKERLGLGAPLAVLALFVLLAVLHTWPLGSAPGSLSRHDNADALLNEWAVAWVAHQIVRQPLQLFDANIFHPERGTLAYSEHLFVQGVLGAPLLWAGFSTTAVHSLLVIAGFALTGWTMALVMRRWTGDWWAAILGGMLLAFNAHSLSRIAHLQAVHVEFLPLALYALDRLLVTRKTTAALWLALAFVLQSLTSNYLLVFMIFGMTGAAVLRLPEWLWPGRARVLALICLSGAIAVVLLAPFLYPYLLARQQGLGRSLEEVATYAASWHDYLAASGRLHYSTWSAPFAREQGAFLFPGVTALVLTGAAVATGKAAAGPARLWLGLGLTGLVLSFGAALPLYEYLYSAVPLLQGIRASVRFGYLVLAAVAALAAFGFSEMRRRFGHRPRLLAIASIAALLLVTAEAARAPLDGYVPALRVPPVYRSLADDPNAVLVELPLYSPHGVFRNAPYMLYSTLHWRPIVNGYSGFLPRGYPAHWEALRVFPDASALAHLRALGVSHVAVHPEAFAGLYGEDRLQRVGKTPGLTLVAHGGRVLLFRLSPGDPASREP
jgi:hypothetical protein